MRGVEDETRRCSFSSSFSALCNLTTRVSFKVCSAIFFLLTHPPLHLEQRFKCANERGAVVRVMRHVFNNCVKVCACVCVGFCFAYLYSDKTEKGMCRSFLGQIRHPFSEFNSDAACACAWCVAGQTWLQWLRVSAPTTACANCKFLISFPRK